MLQWLLQQGCKWNGWAYFEAARAGRLDIFHWAQQEGLPFPPVQTAQPEPKAGTPQAARLHFSDPTGLRLPKGDFLRAAIKGGHVSILDWALNNGWEAMMGEVHRSMHALSIGWGPEIPVLDWALEHEFLPRNARPCTYAAMQLDLILLNWLHSQGFPVFKGVFWWAAESCRPGGNPTRLPVMRWLKSIQCPWGAATTSAAADRMCNPSNPKNIEPLLWLLKNGCPVSSKIVGGLVDRGFVCLALWVQRRGAACKGPALAELELYIFRQQELCRCFALANKACKMNPQLYGEFSAMAAIPWELQQRISQLAFAVIW